MARRQTRIPPESQPGFNPRDWLIPLILAVFAFLIYANTLSGQMFASWDDNDYVKSDPLIHQLTPASIGTIFTQPYFAAYIPMTLLSFAINYKLGGLNPFGYHFLNVLLQALNTALVYLFLARLLRRRWIPLIAALLFTVHPLQVETVAWVAERKNLLCMFFFLLSFLAYMRASEPGANRWLRPLSWLLFVLSAMAKPAVAGVGVLFVAYDMLWMKIPLRQAIIRNIVPLAISAATAVLIVAAHATGGGIKTYVGNSPFTTFEVMLMVFWDYAVSIFAPFHLNALYLYPAITVSQNFLSVILGGILVVLSGVFAWKQPLGKPFCLFSVLWFWIFMLPVSNIIPISIERADRYMYFPSIVIFALLGILGERIWNRFNTLTVHRVLMGGTAVVVVVLAVLTLQRNAIWHDEGQLWSDHLKQYPNSEAGLLNLAVYDLNAKDFADAKPNFAHLLQLEPDSYKANMYMGDIAMTEKRYPDAASYYRQALAKNPDQDNLSARLGAAFYFMGDYTTSIAYYEQSRKMYSNQPGLDATLGQVALQGGNIPLALQASALGLQENPNDPMAATNLCAAQMLSDQAATALLTCQTAVNLAPKDALTVGRLANALMMNNRPTDALAQAQQAIELGPGIALGYQVAGNAYAALGDVQNAAAEYQTLLNMNPNDQSAQAALAKLQQH